MNNHLSSSKLPTPLTSETTRRDAGNFFPLPGFASPQSSCSFDSLLPKNDPKQRQEDEREEIEAAKKRKKALQQVDQQGVTPPPSATTALCSTPDLDSPISNGEKLEEAENLNYDPLSSSDEESANLDSHEPKVIAKDLDSKVFAKDLEPTLVAKDLDSKVFTKDLEPTLVAKDLDSKVFAKDLEPIKSAQASTNTHSSAEHATNLAKTEGELKKESVEALQLKSSIESTVQPDPHGMENAPNDTDMISIVTSDAMEFGTSPLNGLSLASPPVANSMAAAMADESSVLPIQASGGSSESSLGNFSQGAGAAGAPLFNNMTSKASRTSEATAVLKTLSVEVEKLKQTGKSQIDLELPVSETESVKIRLQVRGDEIRSVFITESPELRNALQKSWSEFAQNSRDRGFRFGDPTFQNHTSQNNSAFEQGQQRGQSRNPQTDEPSYPGYNVNRQQPRRSTTNPTSGNSVSLWA